jgi:hypothetical protein
VIDVTVTGNLGDYVARAEAPDPESALVAARTLWDDAQDAVAPYFNGCVILFALDGKPLLRSEARP